MVFDFFPGNNVVFYNSGNKENHKTISCVKWHGVTRKIKYERKKTKRKKKR